MNHPLRGFTIAGISLSITEYVRESGSRLFEETCSLDFVEHAGCGGEVSHRHKYPVYFLFAQRCYLYSRIDEGENYFDIMLFLQLV